MATTEFPQLSSNETELRKIIQIINSAMRGKVNALKTVTLTTSTATTSVTDERIGPNSWLGLMPSTTNAASALGSTFVLSCTNGSAVLTHSSNGIADRTYQIAILG